jgi:hypothetical protein
MLCCTVDVLITSIYGNVNNIAIWPVTQLMDVTISLNEILSHYVDQQIPEIGTHVTILCNNFATPRRSNFKFTRVAL